MTRIEHEDGTIYHLEHRANTSLSALWFVYARIKGRENVPFYSRVYAINEAEAISKARAHYAQHLGVA